MKGALNTARSNTFAGCGVTCYAGHVKSQVFSKSKLLRKHASSNSQRATRAAKLHNADKVSVCSAQVEDQAVPTYGAPIVNEEKLRSWFNGFNVDFEQVSCVKVAITGRKVGSLLGMGGSRVQALQESFNVRIFVTGSGDNIPGTRQRLVYVHGVLGNCMMVLSDILEDITDDVPGEFGDEQVGVKKLGVVFPIELSGRIFGEGGSMIRNLMNVTGVTVSAQLAEHMFHMQDVRKFDIIGTPEQVLQAYMGLLALCVSDQKYIEFAEVLPTAHTDTEWLPRFLGTLPKNNILMNATYDVQIGVPESFVPRLLGKQATNLIRLLQQSGNCQIDVSRDQFVEGTDLRKVTLKGNFKDVMKAQAGLDKMIRDSIRQGLLDPAEFVKSPRYYNNNRPQQNTRR